MANKFWEREDFDIALFAAVMNGVYKVYYDSCDYGEEYTVMIWKGGALWRDKQNIELAKMYADYVQDAPTSDRELAAFAAAYDIFEKWNVKN